jgi:hypothetical protein
MRKAGQVFHVIILVFAISAVAGWAAGPEAAGSALLMISIGLGAYFGAGWGGDRATKAEGYRQTLISKKRLFDAKPDLEAAETEEETNGRRPKPPTHPAT